MQEPGRAHHAATVAAVPDWQAMVDRARFDAMAEFWQRSRSYRESEAFIWGYRGATDRVFNFWLASSIDRSVDMWTFHSSGHVVVWLCWWLCGQGVRS